MNQPALRRVAGGLAFALCGCDGATAPEPQKLVDVQLDFCSNDTPVWFAFQNEDAAWAQLTANGEGTYSFTANNHVILAFVRQNGNDYATEIIYTTSTDLEQITGLACLEEGGSKRLNGSIAGVTSQSAVVTMNFSSVKLDPPQTTFTLTQLADRPLDLVASRVNIVANSQASDRVILRRSVNLVNNATMPALDFGSAEAIVPGIVTATVTGLGASETTLLQNNFFSQLETSHTLSAVSGAANGPSTVVTLPASALAAGDYHDLFAFGFTADGSVRGIERFFGAPANQSLVIGGALATPIVSTVATSPYIRLRASLSRQAEYGSAIDVDFSQQHTNLSVTSVSITATERYFGSRSWNVDIPNLSGVTGWQNSWGLVSGGGTIEWTVTAFNGRPELLFGAKPSGTETVNFAGRSSSTSALRAYRSGQPTVRLPRPFSRAR